MKVPSLFVSALLAAAIVFLQYLLGHLNTIGLPDLYAPIVVVVLNTIIKAIQEWQTPEPTAATRGMNGEQPQRSYAERVLIG